MRSAYRYETDTDEIVQLENMEVGRFMFQCHFINGRVIVIGGSFDEDAIKSLEIHDV